MFNAEPGRDRQADKQTDGGRETKTERQRQRLKLRQRDEQEVRRKRRRRRKKTTINSMLTLEKK